MDWIFKWHLFLTLYMTGLIWFVQVVHYPLMSRVGQGAFIAYERAHTRRTTWVTMPAMLGELATGLWLLLRHSDSGLLWANMILLSLIWMSTFFIQVPLHNRLSRQFNSSHHRLLVQSNWIRTVLWTLRAGLLLWL